MHLVSRQVPIMSFLADLIESYDKVFDTYSLAAKVPFSAAGKKLC